MTLRSALVGLVVCSCFALAMPARANDFQLKYFVEVQVPDPSYARNLTDAGFDIAGIDRASSLIGVVVTPEELDRLEKLGFPVFVRSSNEPGPERDALSDYTDPVELNAFIDTVVATYPNLARKVTLRNTLFDAQKQYAVLITKDPLLSNDRPAFILDAQHHAREVMTPEIAKDAMDYLTSRYATDSQVQNWVDNINIWIVPSVNPDGAMQVFTGDTFWRKNRHPGCAVDNNRNYPAFWGACNGSSSSCSAETTRGTSAASEPETTGLLQLTADARPFFTLSYHSYGEYLMYPYGCTDPDEKAAFNEIAQGLNSIMQNDFGVTGQFATGPIWSTIYLADGGSVDAQYNLYGAYGYILEVNNNAQGFQPTYATWRNVTVQRQRTAWQYFLDKTLTAPQIRGTITDALTGLPLAANLSLQEVTFTHGEAQRKADSRGLYHLLVKSNGTYHITASLPGYCSWNQEVVVGTGPATVNMVLGQPGVPQGVSAAAGGDNAIDVSWQSAANATHYRVLRSLSSGGPYTEIAVVPAPQTSYHDTPVSGSATYHYVVKAMQGCDSAASAQASAATTGPCTAGPAFAGVAAVTNAASATCTLNVTWPAASTGSRCGGSVTYNVYRSATAPFVPGPSNLIASGLSGLSYADHGALANATPYSYMVRAVDVGNGSDDGNVLAATATPTGPNTIGTWTDNAGDTGTAQLTPALPWSVLPTGGKTAPKVYATGSYGNGVCAALTSPALNVQGAAVLTFASKYDMESDYDAGIVEVATGPGYGTWTKLPMNYPDDLLFTGNACALPTSGANTVFSRTFATPTYPGLTYSGSLGIYSGQSIKLRWRFTSDGGVVGQGWWVDDVSITNSVIPGTCSAGTAPNPKEAAANGAMQASRGAGTAVDVTYAPGCGTLDNAVYWGVGPIVGAPTWTSAACGVGNSGHAIFDPGDPAVDTFFYFVVVGQNGTKESSYGPATGGERAEAVGVGACDKPQDLTGTCP